MIYADHAATTMLDRDAFHAMEPYLLEDYGNPSQLYSFGRRVKKAIEEARACIASCIGADTDEITVTSGGTESDNWAIQIAARHSHGGDIVTTEFEHHAVLNACQAVERSGVPVVRIRPNASGVILPSALENSMKNTGKLVSVMSANNEIGTIQPVTDLCATAHRSGTLFHTDAVQAVGHIRINVRETGVDYLSASAHKFCGPKGIGFLYHRRGAPILPMINGGGQEAGFRAGTENAASIVGMATALKKSCQNLDKNTKYIINLEAALLASLTRAGIPFLQNGKGVSRLPGLISLSFPGKDGEAILHRMDLMGIYISTGSACDSQRTKISHVLQSIGLNKSLARGTIRISLGTDNTEEDMESISSALKKILL